MTRLIKLFTIILIFPLTGIAQNIDIKWSADLPYTQESTLPVVVSETESNLYILKGKSADKNSELVSNFYIEVYDKKNVALNKKIEFNQQNLPATWGNALIKIAEIDNKFFIFSFNSQKKKSQLLVSQLDLNGATVVDGKVIDEIENITEIPGKIAFSSEKGHFVASAILPANGKENVKLRYTVLDKTLNKVSKEISLPYPAKGFNIGTAKMDDNGNIYQNITSVTQVKKEDQYTSRTIYFSIKTQEVEEFNYVDLDNLSFDKNGNLAGISIAIEKNSNVANAHYSTEKFPNNTLKSVTYTVYEAGTLKTLKETKASLSKQQSDAITNDAWPAVTYNAREFYITDTTIICIFEETMGLAMSSMNAEKTIIYNYKTIVAEMNTRGGFNWVTFIPKAQTLEIKQSTGGFKAAMGFQTTETHKNDKYGALLSYLSLYQKGNLYFLYNDNKENINKTATKELKFAKFDSNTSCYLAQIDSKGKLTRKILFSNADIEHIVTPLNSVQISEEEAIVFTFFKKKKVGKIGIISLKQ